MRKREKVGSVDDLYPVTVVANARKPDQIFGLTFELVIHCVPAVEKSVGECLNQKLGLKQLEEIE